ncbi:MarR family transcriptional regulator [Xanthobacter sp. V4C-4]|uniref:MarR family winged helix-turn-helix transcriptional regulator n=1 Tax=Xanthobacter cornucopiae TaxID=3119924 RepID=UPI0037291835
MSEHPPSPMPRPRLDHHLCFAIYAAGHAFNRVYKPLLEAIGLTYPQYLVMLLLWEQDDVPVGALGERLSLDSSTLTPLLKRLEAMGHLTRARDTRDERVVRVRLTPQGRALEQAAERIPECILAATGLEIEDLTRLQHQITALRARLEQAVGG